MNSCLLKIKDIKCRDDIPLFMEQQFRTQNSAGVEVGVQHGDYASVILKNWPSLNVLYLVDPWHCQENYNDVANVPTPIQQRIYESVVRRFKDDTRAHICRVTSLEAAHWFARGEIKVKMAYIDANHSYAAVYQDVRLWAPLIESGGILCGHDYLDGKSILGDFGVKSALEDSMDFLKIYGFDLSSFHVTKEDWPSWIIQKK